MNNESPFILETSGDFIDMVDNHIYFYSDIDTDRILRLIKYLKAGVANSIDLHVRYDLEMIPPVYLHINSGGGLVLDSFLAMDEITSLKQKAPIITVVEGLAASGATLLSIVGSHRQIKKNSYMLIHQINNDGNWAGNYTEIKTAVDKLDKLMDRLVSLYQANTKIPKKQLDEILKMDQLWDAETCLKYGLVDEII